MTLQVHNLTKKYYFVQSTQTLFENLNITFPKFGIVCIVGKSGCGKTTLLHILAGLDENYEGEVIINNRNINDVKNYQQEYISFIYQNYHLFDFLNVYENCIFYNKIKGIKFNKKEVEHLLHIFNLEKEKNKNINELSGGQKQRVAIIRALLSHCPMILCDEPTGSLNESHKILVYKYLKKYSKNHLIVIVSHDLRVKEYSDHIIDFDHLKHYYDFSMNKYQRYASSYVKKNYSFLKEIFLMLLQQKSKLLMIFLSQIFIVISITLLVTGLNGMNNHFLEMKENTINNNLITIQKKNKQLFQEKEVKELKGTYNYLLDIGKIKNIDYFQSYSIDQKMKANEVIINQAMYKKLRSKKLSYFIDNQCFDLSVKDIIDDDNDEAILYYDAKTIMDEIKYRTIDLSTCSVYINDYHKVKNYISRLNKQYEGYCFVEDEYDAYYQLMNLCRTIGFIFIILSIIIAIVLILFILLTMFIEFQKDYVVFFSNGMRYSQYVLFLLKQILIICFFNSFFSNMLCLIIVRFINYLDISKYVFKISHIFKYPVFFYNTYDLYLIYFISYFLIGIILFLIVFIQLKKIDTIAILREE